jgi:hypothetical protein
MIIYSLMAEFATRGIRHFIKWAIKRLAHKINLY